jgi:glycosyltransferase involved in cell wall biosynthesis/SAM-dependent methyltransferase
MTSSFYRAFEDRHRGSRELIKSRQKVYLPFITPLKELYGTCPALDLGCGRGEWLEVLSENGFLAKGVDLDEGMLEACKALHLPAEQGDALQILESLQDESLAVVSGFHIAEHIPFDSLQHLVSEALRVLKPAGLLILETPNAENIVVGSSSFYLDPTHERPIPHLLMTFLAEYTGFERVKLLRLHEPEALQEANTVDLMSVLGSASPDYAIISQKGANDDQMALFDLVFAGHYGLPLDVLAERYDQGLSEQINSFRIRTEAAEQTAEYTAANLENLAQRTFQVEKLTSQLKEQLDDSRNVEKLTASLQQTQQQLNESLANAHYWWLQSEELKNRIDQIHSSTSWRITWPLRFGVKMLRSGVRSPLTIARQFRHALIGNKVKKRKAGQPKQIFVDVSELMQRDARTGIQRVVRSILSELLQKPPAGFEVMPVYGTADGLSYQYVQVTQGIAGLEFKKSDFAPVDYQEGDIFLGLDLQHHVVISHAHEYQKMRAVGVKLYFVIYDLLPIFMPNSFWLGASQMHSDWLSVIAQNDGAICISKAVADEYHSWLLENGKMPQGQLNIGWFHLGADLDSSAPTKGLPENATGILELISSRLTFLVVGTVEPRKGHAQTLKAFSQLWTQGVDVNLVLIGKQGWNVETLADDIKGHTENGRRLIWIDNASDEYLEAVYKRSTCLVAASEGEGFGLPLIEAAQHEIPIIARDLPVFLEVAGEHAFYFSGKESADLADAILVWLELNQRNDIPQSIGMRWLTWEQSAQQLKGVLLNGEWDRKASKPETTIVSKAI